MEKSQVSQPKTAARRPRKTSPGSSTRQASPRKRQAQALEAPAPAASSDPPRPDDGHGAAQHTTLPHTKSPIADAALATVGALIILLFLASQIISQLQVQTSLTWQLRSSDRQVDSLEREIVAIAEADRASTILLGRAEEVAESYNALFNDLLALAETDPDAQAIVAKYQIRNLEQPESAAGTR